MSVTLTKTPRYECSREECDTEAAQPTLVEGSYCSQRCADLVAGENLLRHIRHDHRFCHACFRQLKEIERPPASKALNIGPVDHDPVDPTVRNVLVGFEYLTEHADRGDQSGRLHVDAGDDHRPTSDDVVLTGTICSCGTTDHRDAYLRLDEVVSVANAAHRLASILAVLGQEGQHDKTVDAKRLLAMLEAQADRDKLDWALALGRAIDG